VAGALAALALLESRPELVTRLQANAAALRDELAREGFDVWGCRTQIVPIIVGDAALAVEVCEAALERGVFAQAIRPPTVPPMTSRLRLAVMASHRPDELRAAAQVIAGALRAAGVDPRDIVGDAVPDEDFADESAPAERPPARTIFDIEVSDRLAA
jgi:glycine C-acetyltransferase/8-amino-7-oxononanoate synthase